MQPLEEGIPTLEKEEWVDSQGYVRIESRENEVNVELRQPAEQRFVHLTHTGGSGIGPILFKRIRVEDFFIVLVQGEAPRGHLFSEDS